MRIDALLKCNIFDPQNRGNPLLQSAFIEVLVCLRDVMHKTEKYVKRIDFTDDVTVKGEVKDVSSLIKYVRDAVCPLDSDKHDIEPGDIKASFNVQFGKGVLLKTQDFEQSNPYQDDIFSSATYYAQSKSRDHCLRRYYQANFILEADAVRQRRPSGSVLCLAPLSPGIM